MHYLSICAIVANERDLPEWVAYHLAVGVEHVYLYDNGNSPPAKDALRGFVEAGLVTITGIGGRRKQLAAYNHGLKHAESEWLAFIDADEFLLPHKCDDVRLLLAPIKQGALAVNWMIFGSNHLQKRPDGLVIEAYTMRAKRSLNQNFHVKSIVRVADTECPSGTPHLFRMRRGGTINEQGRSVRRPLTPPSMQRIQLNHYFTKSREDWERKVARGRADSFHKRDLAAWDSYDACCNEVLDERILRFAPMTHRTIQRYA